MVSWGSNSICNKNRTTNNVSLQCNTHTHTHTHDKQPGKSDDRTKSPIATDRHYFPKSQCYTMLKCHN